VLRLVSGGQDCEVALWDFSTVGEDPAVLRYVQWCWCLYTLYPIHQWLCYGRLRPVALSS